MSRAPAEIVLFCGSMSWDGTWGTCPHLALRLSKRFPVLWVDPMISWLSPLRDRNVAEAMRQPGLRQVAPNVIRLSPVVVPGVTRPVLREIAIRQARHAVTRAVRRLGARVRCTIVTTLDDMLDVVPTDRRVFYGTDDYVAGAKLMGVDAAWLERRERRQLAVADTVVAISPVLRDKLAMTRPDVAMIPNGCDIDHYAHVDTTPLPADIRLRGSIAGFVGHLNDRIDVTLIEAVAGTGAAVLLVGPCAPTFDVARMNALLARPNVQWVGPKAFKQLPGYLRAISVGLTPYKQSTFNQASFPLKTLEYLAAGRPVVATDLPAHRWLDSPHIAIARSPDEFVAATTSLLGRNPGPAEVAERQTFATEHSWDARATELAALIGLDDAATPTAAALRGS